jgi:hypothetical protein
MSEFKELELEIDNLGNEAAEERMRALLRQINGVHTARITANGVHLIYNPLGVTHREITHTVNQAGFTVDYTQPS